MKLKLVTALVSAVLALLFALQNAEEVEVHFLFWGFTLPRALLLLAVFGVGTLFGLMLSALLAHAAQKRRR